MADAGPAWDRAARALPNEALAAPRRGALEEPPLGAELEPRRAELTEPLRAGLREPPQAGLAPLLAELEAPRRAELKAPGQALAPRAPAGRPGPAPRSRREETRRAPELAWEPRQPLRARREPERTELERAEAARPRVRVARGLRLGRSRAA
jgi:hypothetical protein